MIFSKPIFKFVILMLCPIVLLCSCDSQRKLDYYSDYDNYVNATGIIDYISYSEEDNTIYINFSETTPQFDDTCFKIVGENVMVVQEREISNKIQIGDQVGFITAPKYFGDGYVMPIVSISTNDEKLLSLDEGIDNFLEFLK